MSASRLLILIAIAVFALPTLPPASAQRGALIEDLFRTIAEAQLEREQRKRVEAEQAAAEARRVKPIESNLNVPPRAVGPGRGRPGEINVRSRQAAVFAQDLVNFSAGVSPLVDDLRSAAGTNPTIRALLPDAYHVAADTRALLHQCDGLAAVQPIVPAYSDLDARWRRLSFSLRGIEGLSDRCTSTIRSCDQLVGSMANHLGIQPQFDRHGLHDLMIIAATHMETLMDDLQMASISHREAARLTHECRLLRQRLLGEADHVDRISYDQVVSRFNEFVTRWRSYASQVYDIPDPYLHRRLNRIAEVGDETYALLWMPPPFDAGLLLESAHRLERNCDQLLDQLTLRTLGGLPRQDQMAILESSRSVHQLSRQLEDAAARGLSRNELQATFRKIDRDWGSLRQTYTRLPGINNASISGIDHECGTLRRALGVTSSVVPAVDLRGLTQLAAAIESGAAYLDADVQRYQRNMQPQSYRRSIVESSREFYRHAKQLHSLVERQSELRVLQREAEQMLDGWQQLTKDIGIAHSRGLSDSRAGVLQEAHRELAPLVAQAVAALLDR